MKNATPEARFAAARMTYNYCGVCGRRPSSKEEPNRAPLRWWDSDDGWKIGSLCRWCADECLDVKPKADDYAMVTADDDKKAAIDAGIPTSLDAIDTDEDATEALEGGAA